MPEDRVRVSPQKRYVDQGLEDLPLKRPKLVVSEEQSFDDNFHHVSENFKDDKKETGNN